MAVSFSSLQRSAVPHPEAQEPSVPTSSSSSSSSSSAAARGGGGRGGGRGVDPVRTAFSEEAQELEGVTISVGGRTITIKGSVVQQPQGQTEDERNELTSWCVKNYPAIAEAYRTKQTLLEAAEKLKGLRADDQVGMWKQSPVAESSLETTPESDPEAELRIDRELESWAREKLRRIGCPPCCPPEVSCPVTEPDLSRLSEIDRGATVFYMRTFSGETNPIREQHYEWVTCFRDYRSESRKERGLQSHQLEVDKILEEYGLHFDPEMVQLRESFWKQSIIANLAEYLAWKHEIYKDLQKDLAGDHHAPASSISTEEILALFREKFQLVGVLTSLPTEVWISLNERIIAWTVHQLRVLGRVPTATQGEPAGHLPSHAGMAEAANKKNKKTTQGRKRRHDDDDINDANDNNNDDDNDDGGNGREKGSGEFISTEPSAGEQKGRQKRRKTAQQGVQQSVQQSVQRRRTRGPTVSLPLPQSSRSTRSMARARPDTQFYRLDQRGSAQLIQLPAG